MKNWLMKTPFNSSYANQVHFKSKEGNCNVLSVVILDFVWVVMEKIIPDPIIGEAILKVGITSIVVNGQKLVLEKLVKVDMLIFCVKSVIIREGITYHFKRSVKNVHQNPTY